MQTVRISIDSVPAELADRYLAIMLDSDLSSTGARIVFARTPAGCDGRIFIYDSTVGSRQYIHHSVSPDTCIPTALCTAGHESAVPVLNPHNDYIRDFRGIYSDPTAPVTYILRMLGHGASADDSKSPDPECMHCCGSTFSMTINGIPICASVTPTYVEYGDITVAFTAQAPTTK